MDSRQDELYFLGRRMHPQIQKLDVVEASNDSDFWVGGGLHQPPTLVFGTLDASSDSSLKSVEASTDPTGVGGSLHRPKHVSHWGLRRPKSQSRWRTPVLGPWKHPPTLFFGSADASTDPKNGSSCQLSTDCLLVGIYFSKNTTFQLDLWDSRFCMEVHMDSLTKVQKYS